VAAFEPRIARHCGITVNAMLMTSRSDPLSCKSAALWASNHREALAAA
jgi:hypothetical protein